MFTSQQLMLRALPFVGNNKGIVLQPYRLRLETEIGSATSTGLSAINFTVNQSDTNNLTTVTSVRLKQNDGFICNRIGFFLKTVTVVDPAEPTPLQQVNALSYLYNNPTVFNVGNQVNVGAIYNATLDWQLNSVKYLEGIPMKWFERVGTSQQGTVTAALAGPSEYRISRDENPNALYGMYEMYPLLGFNGKMTNQPSIQLPTSVQFNATGRRTYAVLIMDGILAANGANSWDNDYRDINYDLK